MDCMYLVNEPRGEAFVLPLGAESWDGDWRRRYWPKSGDWDVNAYRVYETTGNGIPYYWELAGPDGAAFLLLPEHGAPKSAIDEAKRWLRNSHDVVHLRVQSVKIIGREVKS